MRTTPEQRRTAQCTWGDLIDDTMLGVEAIEFLKSLTYSEGVLKRLRQCSEALRTELGVQAPRFELIDEDADGSEPRIELRGDDLEDRVENLEHNFQVDQDCQAKDLKKIWNRLYKLERDCKDELLCSTQDLEDIWSRLDILERPQHNTTMCDSKLRELLEEMVGSKSTTPYWRVRISDALNF